MDRDALSDDALAIRLTLERYFSCIDRRDWAGLGDCFAEDALATYDIGGPELLTGRAAIVDRLRGITRMAASAHQLSHASIIPGAGTASAETLAIAHLVTSFAPGSNIFVRGVRYDDTLVCHDGVWRLHRRTHSRLWQYQVQMMTPGAEPR